MEKTKKIKRKTVKKNRQRHEPDKKELHIYADWCKRCGICAAFCPKGALQMGAERPEWKYPEKCAFCRACEYRCPDFAIEMIEGEDSGKDPKD